jgi:hypothetical protein
MLKHERKPLKTNEKLSKNPSTLFSKTIENEHGGVTQTVTVTVNVNKDDENSISGCFKSMFSCCMKGAKTAAMS